MNQRELIAAIEKMTEEEPRRIKNPKTWRIKEAWKPVLEDMKKSKREVQEALKKIKPKMDKAQALHRKFWSMVELDTGEYGRMHYDEKKNLVIEGHLEDIEEEAVEKIGFTTEAEPKK